MRVQLSDHLDFVDFVIAGLEGAGISVQKKSTIQEPLPVTVLEIQVCDTCPESFVVVIGNDTVVDYFEGGEITTVENLIQSLTSNI